MPVVTREWFRIAIGWGVVAAVLVWLLLDWACSNLFKKDGSDDHQ